MRGTRADRLERLLVLQKRLREIEEMRLAELQSRSAALRTEAEAILASLGETSPLNGLFLQAKADRLRRKEAERGAVDREATLAKARLAEAGAKEKRVERIAGEARTDQRAADEAKGLAALLDAYLARPGASLE